MELTFLKAKKNKQQTEKQWSWKIVHREGKLFQYEKFLSDYLVYIRQDSICNL